jgi:hypothetical protein
MALEGAVFCGAELTFEDRILLLVRSNLSALASRLAEQRISSARPGDLISSDESSPVLLDGRLRAERLPDGINVARIRHHLGVEIGRLNVRVTERLLHELLIPARKQ